MSQSYVYPPTGGGGSSSNASVSATGSSVPGSATYIAARDGSGNLTGLTLQANGSTKALDVGICVSGTQVDPRSIRALTSSDVVSAAQSGTWNITNVSGTVSLPTGAATSSLQTTGNTSLSSIATSSSSIDGKLTSLGQKTMANSMPVVLASDWVDVPRANASSLANNVGNAGSTTLSVAGCGSVICEVTGTWAGTLTFSASLDGTTFYNISGISVSAPTTPVSTTTANGVWRFPCSGFRTFKVAMTSFTSGTAVVSLVAGQAPASVEVRQQTAGALLTSAAQSGTWTVQPGNTANTTAWLTTQAGRAKANAPVRNDYTGTNVTTAAYVQLVASLTSTCNEVEIFDSSGQDLVLATGGVGSEVDQIGIFPGGNGRTPLTIASGTRVSVKAKSATANVGVLLVNFYA